MRFRQILAFAKKDLIEFSREYEALFWVIVFPIIFLAIAVALWTPSNGQIITVKIGVVYNDNTISLYQFNATTITDILSKIEVKNESVFNIYEYKNVSSGLKSLRKGDIDTLIVFPEKFSQNLTYGFTAFFDIYVGGDIQRRQIVRAMVTQFFLEFSDILAINRTEISLKFLSYYGIEKYFEKTNISMEMIRAYWYGIARPLNFTVKEVLPETLSTRESIIGWHTLSMIGVQILYTGLFIGALALVTEKETGTLRRILSAPVNPWNILIGKTLGGFIETGISILITIVVGIFVFGAKIMWNPFNPAHLLLIPLLILGELSTIGIGLIISIFTKSARGASGIASATAWPLMMLTGIVLPRWLLPPEFEILSYILPLSQIIDITKNIVVWNKGLDAILPVFPQLIISNITIYIIGLICYKTAYKKMLLT